MASELDSRHLLSSNFGLFVRQVFRYLRDGEELGSEPYLKYLCAKAEQFAATSPSWMLVNLPPQHLKTFIFSICLSAWILGHEPSTRIIVVCNNEDLCVDIADSIREVLRSDWFCLLFETRLRSDRTKRTDFVTVQNGGVYAIPIGTSITGRGCRVLIIDDPLDIADSSNLAQIKWVNATVATKYLSRLSDPSRARVIIIAHRLHPQDLTGSILAQRDPKWMHICLPLIAMKEQIYG